jgi:hypothetical protein
MIHVGIIKQSHIVFTCIEPLTFLRLQYLVTRCDKLMTFIAVRSMTQQMKKRQPWIKEVKWRELS